MPDQPIRCQAVDELLPDVLSGVDPGDPLFQGVRDVSGLQRISGALDYAAYRTEVALKRSDRLSAVDVSSNRVDVDRAEQECRILDAAAAVARKMVDGFRADLDPLHSHVSADYDPAKEPRMSDPDLTKLGPNPVPFPATGPAVPAPDVPVEVPVHQSQGYHNKRAAGLTEQPDLSIADDPATMAALAEAKAQGAVPEQRYAGKNGGKPPLPSGGPSAADVANMDPSRSAPAVAPPPPVPTEPLAAEPGRPHKSSLAEPPK